MKRYAQFIATVVITWTLFGLLATVLLLNVSETAAKVMACATFGPFFAYSFALLAFLYGSLVREAWQGARDREGA